MLLSFLAIFLTVDALVLIQPIVFPRCHYISWFLGNTKLPKMTKMVFCTPLGLCLVEEVVERCMEVFELPGYGETY